MAAMTTTDGRMATSAAAPADAAGEAAVAAAERRVYAAECWLHATRQSGIDEWVAGASAMLREAIEEFFRLGGTWSRPY
jgi:hypothetical protein